MSAIAGAVRRGGADPLEVKSGLAALAGRLRGPVRFVFSGDAGLAGDDLEFLQPNAPADSLSAVADARLDNRDELLSTLGGSPTWSNARLIIAAYRKWREDTPSHLLGDFAFALWDPDDATLFCARDHLGVRPFLYARTADQVVFGSELKAILAFGGSHRFNEARIGDFLASLTVDTHSTDYDNIFRLPPGHWLRLRRGEITTSSYWRPAATEPFPARDSAQAFADLLDKAVAARTTPAASSLLSGGLDSSAVSIIAAGKASSPLKTFSLVFETCADERRYIDDALGCGRFTPTFVTGDHSGPFDDFEQTLKVQDGLFQAPNLASNQRLYAAAARSGADALLDGHGGDEVVSHGLGWLKELSLAGRWGELWRNLPAEADIYKASRLKFFITYWSHLGATRGIIGKAHRLNTRVGRRMQRVLGHPPSPPPWRRFINPAFLHEAGVDARWHKSLAARNSYATEADQHLTALTAPIQAHALEVLDRASSHAGVEARYPFWDKRLVEFCLSLRPDEKIRNGWTRYTFRNAMEGVLPPSIQWRRDKFDFTSALASAMCRHNRELLDDTLLAHNADLARFVDLKGIRAAYARIAAQPQEAAGPDVQAVWQATALALWLRSRRTAPGVHDVSLSTASTAMERAHA